MERAEPWAAARHRGRAGEAPGKVARCLRQPRRAGPVAGAGSAGAGRGERAPPGGSSPWPCQGGQERRPGGEPAELLSRNYVQGGLPPFLGLVGC